MDSDEVIVKRGTYLYDGTVLCDVRIVKTSIRYGSGDYEDLPEIAEDQEGEFYDIQWGSTTQRGIYTSGEVGLVSLEEAVQRVEQAPGIGRPVRWID